MNHGDQGDHEGHEGHEDSNFARQRRLETEIQAEAKALRDAIPERPVQWRLRTGVVLTCGHTVAVDAVLEGEKSARCLECYKEAMVQAEMLLGAVERQGDDGM